MKTFTLNAVLFVSVALASASASATQADRHSDLVDDADTVVSHYSGHQVIRGLVVTGASEPASSNPYSGQTVVRGQVIMN